MKYMLVILLIVGCTPTPVEIERIPFDETEFNKLPKTGNATITGNAFIAKHVARNVRIRLNPKTKYSQQWYIVNYINYNHIGKADPRYLSYIRMTSTDDSGMFTFTNVPAGEYYISAPIFWITETMNEDGSLLQKFNGKFICFEIAVGENQVLTVNITEGEL